MSFAGDIGPRETWQALQNHPHAVLVDVRTAAEWKYVGVPDTSSIDRPTLLVEWVDFQGAPNQNFVAHLTEALGERPADAPVYFLCRSGQRSAAAAQAATAAGITPAYNVSTGFEGPLDEFGHRGKTGWRAEGLPWRQS